uniref:Adaptor related protein complex 1 subunit sigma 3 n=1 Tax=Anas platyrhynchos platyrhynchos TaxID=8840 RepID=A0A493TTQ1_ANAPP
FLYLCLSKHCKPRCLPEGIHFILLFSRQGKLRLQKWYTTLPDKEKKKIVREIVQIVLARHQKTSSFVDWKDLKLVYKRYASLYFCCAIEDQDNELLTLEVVHRYVELLDRYFGNVCELDIIFNFEKAYFILDEFIIGGEVQDTSKRIWELLPFLLLSSLCIDGKASTSANNSRATGI